MEKGNINLLLTEVSHIHAASGSLIKEGVKRRKGGVREIPSLRSGGEREKTTLMGRPPLPEKKFVGRGEGVGFHLPALSEKRKRKESGITFFSSRREKEDYKGKRRKKVE